MVELKRKKCGTDECETNEERSEKRQVGER